jgi:hypothetical protein
MEFLNSIRRARTAPAPRAPADLEKHAIACQFEHGVRGFGSPLSKRRAAIDGIDAGVGRGVQIVNDRKNNAIVIAGISVRDDDVDDDLLGRFWTCCADLDATLDEEVMHTARTEIGRIIREVMARDKVVGTAVRARVSGTGNDVEQTRKPSRQSAVNPQQTDPQTRGRFAVNPESTGRR